MKNVAIVSFALMLFVTGVANSAITTATYQVSAGPDDGFATAAAVQDITAGYLKIGDERTYNVPYQMSGMRFNNVDIPRSATITSAYLKINSINTDYRGRIYGVIAAEASDNPADFSGRLIGNATLTTASVAWDRKTAWSPDTQYTSPDISNVVQEVVNRPGFSNGNSMAIYYSTRDLSKKARSFASYEYNPASATVLEITYETYTISGQILTSEAIPLEGVSVSAGAGIEDTVTDASGYYELNVPPGWSGTVTPNKADWGFNPASQTYSNINTDQLGQDYTAFQPVISGYVKDSSGIGIEGVNVSADNGGGSDTTDINGYYEITVPYDWSGTVTPNKAGWNITPSSQSYINVASDQTNQDFTGFQPTISGSTGISGATVTFSGIGSVVSTPLYSITVPYGWSGTAEATLAEYNFPESPRDHTNVTTDMTGQDFTPYQPTISGYVKDGSGGSIEGVSVSADNGGGSDTTDATGYYEITIPYGWSGTVTPNRLGWQITPSERNYSNVVADQLSQDFLAVYIGIIVKKDGTGDFITIQSAIDAAVPADRIIVYQGTYYENINFNGKNIVLTSTDPNDPNVVASTIINANGSGSVVIFAGSESQSCLLTGFTITGGNSNYYGGGVYGLNTRATITNCIISGNSAIYYGGGLYNCNGTINNCTISGNSASEGGGLYACGGTINNCMISSNSADYGGGLFYCGGTISNCTISGNSANYHGGGLYSCGGVIENCTISGNLANYNGGGLYSCGGVIENCKISDNSANYGGGLFHCNGTINNCTITSNSANYGGGLRNCNGSISNCIIWGNNRTQVSDSSIPSYSCIENWSGGGVGNITEDPVFVNEPNNYHLSGYSPCIDAGDPYYAAEPNETDIDGDPRVMGRIDMGADEVYSSTSALLVIIPGTLNFVAEEMSSGEQSQQISIKNYGAEILNWELSEPNDCNWLNVFPTSGQLNTAESNDVEITVNQNIAGYGTHSCQLQVTAPDAQNSPQVVTVNLEVLRPQIGTNKDYFYFTAHGKSDTSVAGQELVITNTGFDTLNWHIETPNDCNWLSITPQSGQVTDGNSTVTLSVDPNKAPLYGYNYCTLHVIDPNASNSPQAVEVRLNIYGPSIYVNPPRGLYIYAEKNKTAQGSFSIINTGYDVLDWTVEVPNDCNWIKSVSPLSGSCGRSESIEVTVTVDSNGFDLHELYWYWAPLVIDSPQISSPVNYYITLRIYEPNEIHVPYDYPTIQQAVDAAQLYGDMIIVHPGRYAGCNTKAKSLTIRSTEPNNQNIVASTIIGSSIYDSYNEENHYIEINGLSLIWNNDTLPSLRSGLSLAYQDICISNCVIKKWLNGGISIGGYYSLKSKSLIDNCLIIENGNYGISINSVKTFGLDLIIQNCTIAGTKPYYLSNRYGIHIRDSSNNKIYVKNCILKNVTLPGDYEIYRESLGYPSSVTDLDVSYSCIPAGPNSIYIGDANYVNFTYGPGNIESDPCFVREGYLNDNNTPTDSNDDFWVDGDYHLKSRYGCWMPSEFVKMDAKGDAFLDMTDFAVLADEWGKTSQKQIDYPYYPYLYPYLRADLDNSGKVDINDLMIFCENYLYDYDQGWWVTDDVTSPCIDAGDPATPLGDEPSPNGGIINMGAYGGTSQASKSP